MWRPVTCALNTRKYLSTITAVCMARKTNDARYHTGTKATSCAQYGEPGGHAGYTTCG